MGGTTVLDVTGDICLIGGDCDGDGNTDNDFNTLEIVNATNAEILDANDLNITSVTVTNQLWLAAGNADATPGDGTGGRLTLDGNVTAGTQALLQASEGVEQLSGVITSGQLLLGGDQQFEGNGDFILLSNNNVQRIASNISGELQFANSGTLTVSELSFESICSSIVENIDGVTTSDNDAVLIVGGTLMIDAPVNTGAGSVFFDVAGDVTQTETGIVAAAGLGLDVSGNVELAAGNLIDVLAGDVDGTLLLNNSIELVVGSVEVAIGSDVCLLYTSPSPRDLSTSRMPSSA